MTFACSRRPVCGGNRRALHMPRRIKRGEPFAAATVGVAESAALVLDPAFLEVASQREGIASATTPE